MTSVADPLKKERAIRAHKLEMEFFKTMNVHSKVHRSLAKQVGAKAITTKRIDTSKGDESNPDYMARLVGGEKDQPKVISLRHHHLLNHWE